MSQAEDLLHGLDEPVDDALARLDAQASPREQAEDDAPVQCEKVIHIKYRTGDGKVLEGTCVYTVPTVRGLHMIGLRRAELSAGFPLLDDFTHALVEQVAYLEVTLSRRPPWLRELRDLPDPALLASLYGEARLHEATFRVRARDLRPSPAAGQGSGGGGSDGVGAGVGATLGR